MNRRSDHRPMITQPQKLVLALAGLLLVAWVIVGLVFVSTYIQPAAPPPAATARAADPLPTVTPAAPVSTPVPPRLPVTCAASNAGLVQGEARVNDQGGLEIINAAQAYPVALAEIRLPEEPATSEIARERLKELAGGRQAVLALVDSAPNADGQYAGYVFVGELFINYELVRQGLAAVDLQAARRPCVNDLQQAEFAARDEKAGIWQPRRVPTSTFVPLVTLDPGRYSGCDCSIKYECDDFSTHDEAQACYNACNDYNSKLDLDRNGIACEGLP